jgi:hypothetical protein
MKLAIDQIIMLIVLCGIFILVLLSYQINPADEAFRMEAVIA